MSEKRYFVVYKPYGVLSQFTKEVAGQRTLADLGDFPKDVYPVGRLDADSEGLLLLTNDAQLNYQLIHPKFTHEREYWAQVEGIVTNEALQTLQRGVVIRVDGKAYHTRRCKAEQIFPEIAERSPPIRFRKTIPTSWIALTLTEGKNRQVRRMTAAVGFPTLRLLRVRIELLRLENLSEGAYNEVSKTSIYQLCRIKP